MTCDDLVAELVALGVEVDEVELLADGLQRLGELGGEQLLRASPGRWPARMPMACATLMHVLDGLVDPDEERDLDVGADVVLADQALLAGPLDVDRLHRDVHHLGPVDASGRRPRR